MIRNFSEGTRRVHPVPAYERTDMRTGRVAAHSRGIGALGANPRSCARRMIPAARQTRGDPEPNSRLGAKRTPPSREKPVP